MHFSRSAADDIDRGSIRIEQGNVEPGEEDEETGEAREERERERERERIGVKSNDDRSFLEQVDR
jgi:hypothetical protein